MQKITQFMIIDSHKDTVLSDLVVWHQIQGSVFACICEPVSMFVRMMCVYVWPACPCVCVYPCVCVFVCKGSVGGSCVSFPGTYPRLTETRSYTTADKLVGSDPEQSYYRFWSRPKSLRIWLLFPGPA